jgi:hypothetical protein
MKLQNVSEMIPLLPDANDHGTGVVQIFSGVYPWQWRIHNFY